MGYKSNLSECLSAFNAAKSDICNSWGIFLKAEAQIRATVKTGNMRRSTDYEVIPENKGINLGTTMAAPYGIYVEKGTSKMSAQPFLYPAVMDNITKLSSIANEKIQDHMGK